MLLVSELIRAKPKKTGTQIGEAMATRVIGKGTTIDSNILKGDPYAAHETIRIAMEMDSVTVG